MALMVIPYLTSHASLLLVVGLALIAGPYFLRD
jgi:hypothetical protein